jgi:uncharacterized protein
MACRYCWNRGGAFEGASGGLMDRETARHTLELIHRQIEVQSVAFMGISLFGGEPLLNQPVVEYLVDELIRTRNQGDTDIHILLFTNGTILNERLVSRMQESPFIECHVGLDGDQQTHDRYRVDKSGRGTYDVVHKNIETLIERGVFVVAESVVTAPYDYMRLLAEYDALNIRFAYVQEDVIPIRGKGGQDAQVETFDLRTWREQYERFAALYFERICGGSAPLIDPLFTIGKSFSADPPTPAVACTAGTSQIAVSSTGAIYACNQLQEIEAFRIGHVAEGLDEIRYEAFLERLRHEGCMIESNSRCRQCPIARVCRGGCYAKNYLATGSIGEIGDERSCRYRIEKARIDAQFVAKMLDRFPGYLDDIRSRDFGTYFPELSKVMRR